MLFVFEMIISEHFFYFFLKRNNFKYTVPVQVPVENAGLRKCVSGLMATCSRYSEVGDD